MGLPPTNPSGAPKQRTIEAQTKVLAATVDGTSEVGVVEKTSYVTAARLVSPATLTASGTDYRTFALVDASTRSCTDGVVADPASHKNQWVSGAAYTAGQSVDHLDNTYVCISNVTSATEPQSDGSHWQQVAIVDLNYVNSLTAKFTADDVGKAIVQSGNTNIQSGTVISNAGVSTTGQGEVLATPDGNATAVKLSKIGTAGHGITAVIGSSRTLATVDTSANTVTAGAEKDLTLSSTDTEVYKGDVIKLTSTHTGSTGLADPGLVVQVELTSYEEGTA